MSRRSLSIVEQPDFSPLARDEAIAASKAAYLAAKEPQLRIICPPPPFSLVRDLLGPGQTIDIWRLRRMRDSAREQVENAQEVLRMLDRAVTALERYSPRVTSGGDE